MAPTYFDHNATTPVDDRVRQRMVPWLGETFGNPSSIHSFGQRARESVEAAREEVAVLLSARPPEVVFTSSGTEANNTVLRAVIHDHGSSGHLVVSAVEHPSVDVAARALAEAGLDVSWIAPDGQGRVDPSAMAAAIRDDTRLVCIVLANNVVGTVQPVAEIAELCHRQGVAVLCDAVQAVGKIEVHVDELGVDFLTLGAHKFYGPLGAAALWVRKGVSLSPLLLGGSQERWRRAGTQNVAAIVGMGEASRLVREELAERHQHVTGLRERFELGIKRMADVVIHGERAERLANTSHAAFVGADSQALLIRLDLEGFAVSAGSACSSGTVEPSGTLLAMGISRQEALSAIRVSFGRTNSTADVDRFLQVLEHQVEELRKLAKDSSLPRTDKR